MTEPGPPDRDEAMKRFDQRLDAFQASTRREPARFGAESGAGAGYRLVGELVGGVLAGLGLGWLLDRIAGTTPIGLIGGLLVGTAASVVLVVHSAGRMARDAAAGSAPAAVQGGADDDEGDNGPG